jgi:hypothetical protein
MEEFNWHLGFAREIHILSKRVTDLIESSHLLKCTKTTTNNQFIHPGDAEVYLRYLFLNKTSISSLSTYPCLFRCCMDTIVHTVDYKHPTIRPSMVYYGITERVSDDDIEFTKLSDESYYTDYDIHILRRTTEQTLQIMDNCIYMYNEHPRFDLDYMNRMRKERNRVKLLLIEG